MSEGTVVPVAEVNIQRLIEGAVAPVTEVETNVTNMKAQLQQ